MPNNVVTPDDLQLRKGGCLMKASHEITIREPNDFDLPTIWTLLQDVSNFLPNQSGEDNLLAQVASQESFFSYVAVLKDEIVGFGSIFIFQRIRGGKAGQIEDIVVRSDVRNLGIGKYLLEGLLSKAWELDCHKVALQASPDSEAFYLKIGFDFAGKSFQIRKPPVRN